MHYFDPRKTVLSSVFAIIILILTAGVSAQNTPVSLRRFDRVLTLEVESTTSANASLVDLNNDNHLDIFLAKGRHWPVENQVFKNNGQGKFQLIDQSWAADKTYSVIVADFDNDGDQDLATSNDRPNNNLILLNNGDGRFVVAGNWGDPNWPTRNACAADLNGDGAVDLIAANRKRPSYICFNDGTGNFDSSRHQELPIGSATTIVPGDFNNDGRVDLALPYRDGGQSQICWNDNTDSFKKTTPFGPPTAMWRTGSAADLNDDGWLDLVTGDQSEGLVVYLNKGGRLEPVCNFKRPNLRPYSLAIADLNLDQILDIVVGYAARSNEPNQALGAVYFSLSKTINSDSVFQQVTFAKSPGAIYGLAVGDVDADGFADIVAARSGGLNAIYFNEAGSPNP